MKTEKLNTFSLTMIVIGFVIGLGIFRTATDAAQASLNSNVFFSAWILGGLIALCGALTYAEIGSRYPITGGYYKIFSYAYHPSIAFALNCVILFSNAASLSGVAIIGSEYILNVIFENGYPEYYNSVLGIIAIISFYGVNAMGLIMSSRTQNVLMIIKLSMLLIIIIAVIWPREIISHSENVVSLSGFDFINSLGAALVAVCFTYGGYQQSINFGEEVHNPVRTVPKGIVSGIIIVILIYLLVNNSYYQIIGFEELKTTKGIASRVAYEIFGNMGMKVFSILLFVAVLAYVNVILLSNPRVMYAMADDKVLPSIFKKKYGAHQVLLVNLTVFSMLSILTLIFASTFERILGFVMFLDSVGMVSSAATIFILRKRLVGEGQTSLYTMKWFPWTTIIFILAYLLVCYTIIRNTPHLALMGTVVFIGFLILFFVLQRFRSKGLSVN